MSPDEAPPESIAIGGFSLQVGGAGGAVVQQSTAPAAEGTGTLARALEEPEPEASAAVEAAETVESASDVTAKCERAVSLSKGVAEGKAFSPDQLGAEVGVLLDLLERLDRKGRYQEELRIARALATLLMLLRRWAALLQMLRTALHAAGKIGDLDAVAWAKHEIGSLRLVAADVERAERDLREAREIRERIGDRRGLRATDHNLGTLCECLRQMLREEELVRRRPRGPRPMALRVLALAALFALAFGAGVLAGNGGSGKQTGFRRDSSRHASHRAQGSQKQPQPLKQSEEEEEEEETTTTTTTSITTTTTTTTTPGPTKEELLKKIEDEEREAIEERRREEAAAAAAKRAAEELEEPTG